MSRLERRTGGAESQPEGDRFGGRFGSSIDSSSPQVPAPISPLAAPTDGAFSTISMPRRRVSRRDLTAIGDSLRQRDWEVLVSVASHRFLTVDQIRRLHFADLSATSSPRQAQKTLQRLRQDRLLGTLDRRIGGAGFGSSALVHYIDVAGHRLLEQEGLAGSRHVKDPTETFLKHTLAVAETHLRLVEAQARNELKLERCELEPECWRSYNNLGGLAIRLRPDLYIQTATHPESDEVESFFVEVDLGSESIPRLIKKCHEYQRYERTGVEQGDDDEHEFPGVIWTMTHRNMATAERRRRSLREAIEHDHKLDASLFYVITPDQLIIFVTDGGES